MDSTPALPTPAALSWRATQCGRIKWLELLVLIALVVLAAAALRAFSSQPVRCIDHPPFFLKGTAYDCATRKPHAEVPD
jgi:hypothetical protein